MLWRAVVAFHLWCVCVCASMCAANVCGKEKAGDTWMWLRGREGGGMTRASALVGDILLDSRSRRQAREDRRFGFGL